MLPQGSRCYYRVQERGEVGRGVQGRGPARMAMALCSRIVTVLALVDSKLTPKQAPRTPQGMDAHTTHDDWLQFAKWPW
jgi:hypothetical protein